MTERNTVFAETAAPLQQHSRSPRPACATKWKAATTMIDPSFESELKASCEITITGPGPVVQILNVEQDRPVNLPFIVR